MNLHEYSSFDGIGLAELVSNGEVSPQELSSLAAEAIAVVNPRLNAVNEVYEDRIETPCDGNVPDGPLAGVPMLNKDLSFAEAGRRQEMGSVFTKGYIPSENSTTVDRLKAAGINIVGRTTTPEFGNSGLTESVISGTSVNPWDTARTCGGSSGGSAAIVAAGAVPFATASDGGGSTRTPASLCGLIGLKPTRGLVPAGPGRGEGGSGLSGSFAVTRTIRDSALLLDIMAGPASGDPYEVRPLAMPASEAIRRDPPKLRIAYTEENWSGIRTSDSCRQGVRRAMEKLDEAGHHIEEAAPVFDWDAFFNDTVTIMCGNLATGIDGLSTVIGHAPEEHELQSSTWACYRYGKSLTAVDFQKALGGFNSVCRAFGRFFETYDLLATPTTVNPAPLLADCYSCNPADPIDAPAYQRHVYSNDHFVCMANATGQPSLSLPVHQSEDGLPVGVQLLGRFSAEDTLFQIGRYLEQAMPWNSRRPGVHVAS